MILATNLKKAVLQSAIHGELIESNANDNAKSLFERINNKRNELIKAGVVRQKQLAEIKELDYPFTIPNNWIFVRLNNIFNFIDYRGKTPKKISHGIRLVGATNIKQGYLDFTEDDKYISQEEYLTRQSRGLTKRGDLLFVTEGGTMGNVSLNTLDECSCGQRVITLQAYEKNTIVNELYMYFIMSDYFQTLLYDKKTGSAATGIKGDILKTLILPLPPYKEQVVLLKRIKKILKEIDKYFMYENEAETIKNELPEKLQSAIILAGIKGQLTIQNENDQSVDDLLRELKVERKQLIKTKAIRDETIEAIIEGDYLFDIPDNWRFVRLGSIIKLLSGQDFSAEAYNDKGKGIPYLTGASNIDGDNIIINRWTESPRVVAEEGDILVTCKGTVGKITILNFARVHIARQFMSIRPLGSMNIKYVYYFMKYYVYYLKIQAKSMIPGINRSMVLNVLIPIPPLEEQKKIVERIEELLPLCMMF